MADLTSPSPRLRAGGRAASSTGLILILALGLIGVPSRFSPREGDCGSSRATSMGTGHWTSSSRVPGRFPQLECGSTTAMAGSFQVLLLGSLNLPGVKVPGLSRIHSVKHFRQSSLSFPGTGPIPPGVPPSTTSSSSKAWLSLCLPSSLGPVPEAGRKCAVRLFLSIDSQHSWHAPEPARVSDEVRGKSAGGRSILARRRTRAETSGPDQARAWIRHLGESRATTGQNQCPIISQFNPFGRSLSCAAPAPLGWVFKSS